MVAIVNETRKLGATVEEGRDYCIITPPKQVRLRDARCPPGLLHTHGITCRTCDVRVWVTVSAFCPPQPHDHMCLHIVIICVYHRDRMCLHIVTTCVCTS